MWVKPEISQTNKLLVYFNENNTYSTISVDQSHVNDFFLCSASTFTTTTQSTTTTIVTTTTIATTATATTVSSISCPITWTQNSGYCYYISDSSTKKTFIEAGIYCLLFGGTLVNFYNSIEWNFYKSVIPSDEFHIGLLKVNNEWYWGNSILFYDGTPATYDSNMWEAGKPDTSGSCGRYLSAQVICNKPCEDTVRFVCEKR